MSEGQVKIPHNSYKVRCLECNREKSKKDNWMFVQTFEIFDSKNSALNGIQIMNWSSLTTQAINMLNVQRQALAMPRASEADLADLNANDYVGKEGAAVIKTEIKPMKNEETDEEIINPNTGKVATTFNHRIVAWLER